MKSEDLIATCRKYLGEKEVHSNSSFLIDGWLLFVGCNPGDSWCAGYACSMIHETDPSVVFKKSASALKFLERNKDKQVSDPRPGDLVIWDHGKGKGHIAIITSVIYFGGVLVSFAAIAGNTSADGKSREGVMVAEHDDFEPDAKIAGYVRVCEA